MARRETKATPAAFDPVRTIGLRLPHVTVGLRYDGAPVLRAAGCFMAGLATHPSAAPGTLVVRIAPQDRQGFLDDAPQTYYVTDYYARHPVVLVRLASVDRPALADLLALSWRLTMAKARPSRRPRGARPAAAQSR